jgi:hypothetical protein
MFNEGALDRIEKLCRTILAYQLELRASQIREEQFEMSTTNSLAALTTAVAQETSVDESVKGTRPEEHGGVGRSRNL